ncbi:S-layer homology domain-containing protein [Ureibacillus endophyticus]|uniref:S-layer homology domain-containing protein n=1 Tax=Ureibacillus endophyticus TaxID=1978490 RepID=A0A494YSR1_9BACL|nr:S-layer homology domain-containing protein [Lysinibacillus endophyticus]RKQ12987.1 S-layer homology domain-containing protein [Lysinibacillus endophyticus]
MANQPKKYKKFVATAATATLVASAIAPVASAAGFSDVANNTHAEAINALAADKVINGYPDGTFKPNKDLTRSDVVKLLGKYLVSKGYSVPADAKTVQRFNDVPVDYKDQELVEYAALVKDAGVFKGSNNNLNAANKITRGQMALVVVRALDELNNVDLVNFVAGQDFDKEVIDLNSASKEQQGAIDVLDFFDITKTSKFNPNSTTTRGQFASFLYRAINTDFSDVTDVVVESVTAINNTTVEVTFKEAVTDLASLNFAIEGLTISNKVVKQTNAKTVVLTTSAQEAGKTYTVTEGGSKLGTFQGVSAVVPTAIKSLTPSLQGTIGKDVTLSAQVTVPEGDSKAGIPVTFNITGANANAAAQNAKIEAVAYTNADGVASYTYTRYYEHNDNVVAYATNKSSVSANSNVYWAESLAVKEISEGNELANQAKKVYEVVGAANTVYYITFEENLNTTSEKIVDAKVIDAHYNSGVTPYQLTNGSSQVAAVKTDSKGKATFGVSGTNVSVTPIVFKDSVNVDTPYVSTTKFAETELNAKAPKVTFSDVLYHDITITPVVADTDASFYDNYLGNGGRDYKVKVLTKDGKAVPAGTAVRVFLDEDKSSSDTYLLGSNGIVYTETDGSVPSRNLELTVDKNGEVVFTVFGRSATAYAVPVAFIDRNKDGDLDKADIKAEGEITRFVAPAIDSVSIKFYSNGKAVTNATNAATARLSVLDKQGKVKVNENTPVSSSTYQARFDITNSSLEDLYVDGSRQLNRTETYYVDVVNGVAELDLTAAKVLTVDVKASYNNKITNGSITFNNSSVIPNVYTDDLKSVNLSRQTLTFDDATYTTPVEYADADLNYTYVLKANALGTNNPSVDSRIDINRFESILGNADAANVTYSRSGDDVTIAINTASGSGKGLVTPAAQTLQQKFNAALAAAQAAGGNAFNFNLGNSTEDLNINIPAGQSFVVTLSGKTVGDLNVTAPDSDIKNYATILGTTTIIDIDNNSFYNSGSLNALVIKDTNGARIVNESAGSIAALTIAPTSTGSTQQLVLAGNFTGTAINVTENANVTTVAGTTATINVANTKTLVLDNKAGSAVTSKGEGTTSTPAQGASKEAAEKLAAAIEDAEAIVDAKADKQYKDYSALETALTQAKKVYEAPNATAADKNAQTTALENAIKALVEATYGLTVTVADASTKEAVTGATIKVTTKDGKEVTDLAKVTNGEYTIKVTKEGYEEYTATKTVKGSDATVAVELVAEAPAEKETITTPEVKTGDGVVVGEKTITVTFTAAVDANLALEAIAVGAEAGQFPAGTTAKLSDDKTSLVITFTELPTVDATYEFTLAFAGNETTNEATFTFEVDFTAATTGPDAPASATVTLKEEA